MKELFFVITHTSCVCITAKIKDEDIFTELCEGHIRHRNFLDYSDLHHFEDDVVELEYDNAEESFVDETNFYKMMDEEGFPCAPDKLPSSARVDSLNSVSVCTSPLSPEWHPEYAFTLLSTQI